MSDYCCETEFLTWWRNSETAKKRHLARSLHASQPFQPTTPPLPMIVALFAWVVRLGSSRVVAAAEMALLSLARPRWIRTDRIARLPERRTQTLFPRWHAKSGLRRAYVLRQRFLPSMPRHKPLPLPSTHLRFQLTPRSEILYPYLRSNTWAFAAPSLAELARGIWFGGILQNSWAKERITTILLFSRN